MGTICDTLTKSEDECSFQQLAEARDPARVLNGWQKAISEAIGGLLAWWADGVGMRLIGRRINRVESDS